MTIAPDLPFHFAWRSGVTTTTLAAALSVLEADQDVARWHVGEGHVQAALVDQGYEVLAENATDADAVPLICERIHVALELHRTWWSGKDDEDISETVATLGRILRSKGNDILHESKRRVTNFRNWVGDLIRSK